MIVPSTCAGERRERMHVCMHLARTSSLPHVVRVCLSVCLSFRLRRTTRTALELGATANNHLSQSNSTEAVAHEGETGEVVGARFAQIRHDLVYGDDYSLESDTSCSFLFNV